MQIQHSRAITGNAKRILRVKRPVGGAPLQPPPHEQRRIQHLSCVPWAARRARPKSERVPMPGYNCSIVLPLHTMHSLGSFHYYFLITSECRYLCPPMLRRRVHTPSPPWQHDERGRDDVNAEIKKETESEAGRAEGGCPPRPVGGRLPSPCQVHTIQIRPSPCSRSLALWMPSLSAIECMYIWHDVGVW